MTQERLERALYELTEWANLTCIGRTTTPGRVEALGEVLHNHPIIGEVYEQYQRQDRGDDR